MPMESPLESPMESPASLARKAAADIASLVRKSNSSQESEKRKETFINEKNVPDEKTIFVQEARERHLGIVL